MSRDPGPTGTYPWELACRTRGPVGASRDAAAPKTPGFLKGDTPGPVGHQDAGASRIEACKKRYCFDDKLLAARKKVKEEIRNTLKIRNGFADRETLAEARKNNWKAKQYRDRVAEKLFGRKKSGADPAVVSPMGIDPATCEVKKKWTRARYRKEGLPDIVYDADLAHERVHEKSCSKETARFYADKMESPEELSKEEVKAYDAKLKVLRKWLRENGVGLEQWVAEHCR